MSTRRRRKPAPRSSPLKDWLPRAEWGTAILLTVLAAAFHVGFMTHAGALWRDEINSFEFATMSSISTIYDSLRYDSFPMLYTLLLRGWVTLGFGHGDGGLRVFGLLIGLASLASLWVACRILGCPSPLLSLTLVGLSPWAVRTTDSIRPYGLGMTLIVLTLALLWRALKTPTYRGFVAAGALAILSVQCMFQNAFLLLAIAVAVAIAALLSARPKAAIAVGLVGAAAASSLLLYAPSISAARSWSVVVQTDSPTKALLAVFSEALGSGGAMRIWVWRGLALLCAVLGVHALRERTKRASSGKPNLLIFNATVLIVATVVYLTAVKATRLLTTPWYYVPLLALLAPPLESSAWVAARNQTWRMGRLALVLAIAGGTVFPGWKAVTERRTNMDAVASYLATRASEGDVILVDPFYFGVSFHRYYRGTAAWMTLPPLEDLRVHRYDLFKAAMVRTDPIDPVLKAMAGALQSGHRVWLVGGLPNARIDRPPPVLPPPPSMASGWYCGPYIATWAIQAAYLLNLHGLRAEVVPPLATVPVNRYENAPIVVISGWH